MPDVTTSRYKFLNERGRIPKGTICPFNSFCFYQDDRCPDVKQVDFSCACARLIDMCCEVHNGKPVIPRVIPPEEASRRIEEALGVNK